jgi:hypothetical protein
MTDGQSSAFGAEAGQDAQLQAVELDVAIQPIGQRGNELHPGGFGSEGDDRREHDQQHRDSC